MAANQSILIISSSLDNPHIEPVTTILEKQGFNILWYQTDKVVKGLTPLNIAVQPQGLHIEYNGQTMVPDQIAAAWFRKPSIGAVSSRDASLRPYLERENRALQEIMWSIVPAAKWLNAPRIINEWDRRKISQLVVAQKLGFAVPTTVITNRWRNILDNLPEKVVMKMGVGSLYVAGKPKIMYSTALSNNKSQLPIHTNPFPGIWQSYLSKKREWRVTVVGKKIFSVAIYTTKQANDDWRKHQHTDHVTFVEETLPKELQQRCLTLLEHMGLRFGAIDFIEDENGNFTFLEINTNGQYAWLEQKLGVPIAAAIASELAAIAARTALAPQPNFDIMPN